MDNDYKPLGLDEIDRLCCVHRDLEKLSRAIEQATIANYRAQFGDILKKLKDPNIVHINMLRGIIAPVTFDALAHVLGDKAKQEWLSAQHAQVEKGEEREILEGPAYGIIDPDYARVFTQARIIAWSYGYACVMHGSFTRDLDLLMVPWEDRASANHEQLLKLIAEACGLRFADGEQDVLKAKVDLTDKPHGRKACSLYFPQWGDRRWVDVSFMPCAAIPAAKGQQ